MNTATNDHKPKDFECLYDLWSTWIRSILPNQHTVILIKKPALQPTAHTIVVYDISPKL
ncbi:MAG: hypothetical protein ACKPKO_21835 [Candidatus Fonsibacter sp.]